LALTSGVRGSSEKEGTLPLILVEGDTVSHNAIQAQARSLVPIQTEYLSAHKSGTANNHQRSGFKRMIYFIFLAPRQSEIGTNPLLGTSAL
jgi:hypothetical protein